MIKGKGQRLIPEELLKYTENLKKNYPDETKLYEAGDGISITGNVISSTGGGGGGATLEDIEDSAGNKRFVEGNGAIASSISSKITGSFIKWSLSGTHLMLVCAGTVNGSYNFAAEDPLATFTDIPEYIRNKIVALPNNYLESKTCYFQKGLTKTSFEASLRYLSAFSKLNIYFDEAVNPETGSYFRIQFDLLIDADYSE